MSQTITAIFDGQGLRPESPVELKLNQRYVITIQAEPADNDSKDGWEAIESLVGTVEAPADWASEHDHYLYGTPKSSIADEF
ncbi:MAG: hypothetical protein WBD47_06105 [Phormidesmis sp.]